MDAIKVLSTSLSQMHPSPITPRPRPLSHFFAHDSELDSTPFHYYEHLTPSLDSPSANLDSTFLVGLNEPVEPLNQTSIELNRPSIDRLSEPLNQTLPIEHLRLHDEPPTLNETCTDPNLAEPEDDDLFGLGSFNQVFLTEAQDERAKVKLNQDEPCLMTRIQDAVDRLTCRWIHAGSCCSLMEGSCVSVQLTFQHLVLGMGRLEWNTKGIQFEGKMLQVHQDLGDSALSTLSTCFFWPMELVSSISCKVVDGEKPLLLFTVDDSWFLQFVFDVDQEEQCQQVAHALKKALSTVLEEKRRAHQQALDNLQQEYDELVRQMEARMQLELKQVHEKYQLERQALLDAFHERQSHLLLMEEERHPVNPDSNNHSNLEHSHTPRQASPMKENGPVDCSLCYSQSATVTLEPCQHQLCLSCHDTMLKRGMLKVCPWDRQPIRSILLPPS